MSIKPPPWSLIASLPKVSETFSSERHGTQREATATYDCIFCLKCYNSSTTLLLLIPYLTRTLARMWRWYIEHAFHYICIIIYYVFFINISVTKDQRKDSFPIRLSSVQRQAKMLTSVKKATEHRINILPHFATKHVFTISDDNSRRYRSTLWTWYLRYKHSSRVASEPYLTFVMCQHWNIEGDLVGTMKSSWPTYFWPFTRLMTEWFGLANIGCLLM